MVAPDREKGGLLALSWRWIFLGLLNSYSLLHAGFCSAAEGFSCSPSSCSCISAPSPEVGRPREMERRRLQNKIRIAGLSHTSVRSILIPFDPPDKFVLLQHCDGLPRRVLRAPTTRRNGFHGRPTLSLLSCTAHQEAVHHELDRCQVITEKRVAEFEKPFS